MVREGALMLVQDSGNVNVNRGVGLRLENVKVRDVGADTMREGEDKENIYVRAGHNGVILGDEEGEPSAEGQMAGALRFQEAGGAQHSRIIQRPPMSPTTQSEIDPDPVTPRHSKRRRIDGIAGSDILSNYDSRSPREKYGGAGKSMREGKRVQDSWEESDPDPDDADVPIPSLEDKQRAMKRQQISPVLLQLLEELEAKFPDHDFTMTDNSFQCFDCEGKTFQPNKFTCERHLNSKQHLLNLSMRSLKKHSNTATMSTSKSRASLGNTSTFSMPPPELAPVAAKGGSLTSRELGAQYFQALESEASEKGIRMTLVENRVVSSETRTTNLIDALTEKFDDFDKRTGEEMEVLNDCVKSAREQNESEIKDIYFKVDGVERRVNDQIVNMEESIAKLKKADAEYETVLLEMSKSTSSYEKTMEALKDKTLDKVANLSGKFTTLEDNNKETLETITERLSKIEKGDKSDRLRQLEKRTSNQRDRVDDIEEKQKNMQKAVDGELGTQTELISDLEMRMQILGEEMKEHREREEQMRETNMCLGIDLKYAQERLTALEIENEEKQRMAEISANERFDDLETRLGAKIDVIVQTCDESINAVLEAFEDQKEKLASLEAQLEQQRRQAGRKEELLQRYSNTLQLQNQLIKVQNQRLERNERQTKEQKKEMKMHAKRLDREEEISKHLKLTVPAFMKDVRMLDDKIEDLIDETAEKEARAEAERVEAARVEEESRRRPVSATRVGPRRASMNPRARRVRHISTRSRRLTG